MRLAAHTALFNAAMTYCGACVEHFHTHSHLLALGDKQKWTLAQTPHRHLRQANATCYGVVDPTLMQHRGMDLQVMDGPCAPVSATLAHCPILPTKRVHSTCTQGRPDSETMLPYLSHAQHDQEVMVVR